MSSFPQLDAENATIKATIKTNMGDVKLALFKEQAPKTVDNFIGLSKEGKYDNVIFHRVINGFMIQGGDPTGTGMGGESIYGKSFEASFQMNYSIFAVPFQWQMPVRILTEVNSLSSRLKTFRTKCSIK